MATLMALATESPDPPMLAGPLGPVLRGLLRHDPDDRLTALQVEERLKAIAGPGGAHHKVSDRRAVVPAPRRPGDAAPAHPGTSAVATTVPDVGPPVGEHDGARVAVDDAGNGLRPRRAAGALRTPPAQRDRPGSAEPVSPPPSDQRRRSRWWPVLAGILAVVLLTGGGILVNWAVRQRNSTDGQAAQSAPPSFVPPSAAGGFTPVACQQPRGANLPRTPQPHARRTAKGYALPQSWSEYVDVSGFRVGVPDGWTYEKIGTTICFRDPDNIRFLSVDPKRNPAGDPVQACRTEAARLIGAGELPQYTLIDLRRTSLQITAADWEYAWTGPTDVRMHAKTRWFKSGDKAFALSWATRDFEWSFNTAPYAVAISSFSGT
jgi:hypothetical protein